MTIIEEIKRGNIPDSVRKIAQDEGLSVEEISNLLIKGQIVILHNPYHKNVSPIGVGKKLRTKVNVNIGTSIDYPHLERELKKLEIAIKYKADTVMDLSTGGDIAKIRRKIIEKSPLPIGTVPIYEAAIKAISKRGSIVEMIEDDLFSTIEEQAKDGVDFMTVHAGLTLKGIERLKKQGRLTNIVSRGGAFHFGWMIHNQKENPLYEKFDRLLEIAKKYNITLSLGDGLRPGSIDDATDWAQIDELLTLGELVKKAWEQDVQVMVEGPGHVPLDQIAMNIQLQKRICHGAPFYVLGPLVTDIAPGYDHITSAIGGALAAFYGADFLCYVTPLEHLGLPDVEDVKEGLIASRIAAHAADIVKGVKGALEWDKKISDARRKLDWIEQEKLSIDPEKFRKIRRKSKTSTRACSMCGKYCAIKIVNEYLGVSGEIDAILC